MNQNLKKVFFALTVLTMFYGCVRQNENTTTVKEIGQVGYSQVFEIDSCEYVSWKSGNAGGLVHKQNCKYCKERNP